MKETPRTLIIIGALTMVCIVGMLFVGPIPQPPKYLEFADAAPFGLPGFYNVASNLAILAVGVLGIVVAKKPGVPDSRSYGTFFAALCLVAVGSSYFHLEPTINRLVWDRLPMSVAFMALFHAVLTEHVPRRSVERLFWPLILAGIVSVVYWYVSETLGRGDLRWYLLVQFLPIVVIVFLVSTQPTRQRPLWLGVIGWYGSAKVFELADRPVFEWTGIIGGHPFKHVCAALAGYWVLRVVRSRRIPD